MAADTQDNMCSVSGQWRCSKPGEALTLHVHQQLRWQVYGEVQIAQHHTVAACWDHRESQQPATFQPNNEFMLVKQMPRV